MGDDMDYSSPEQQREAVRAKFQARKSGTFEIGGYIVNNPEHDIDHHTAAAFAALDVGAQTKGGKATIEKLGKENVVAKLNGNGANERGRLKGLETRREHPIPHALSGNSTSYKSFAAKIRHVTNDGWELIDAVMEIFHRAKEDEKWDLLLNSATWLADRGFGKPVQVTALTDAEGNPVAFQLWQPAANEQGDSAEEPPLIITQYAKPNLDLSAPPTPAEKQPDRFALGPARIWGVNQDKEQIDE